MKARPTERHLLHFDAAVSAAANEVLSYHVAGKDFPVQLHTAETRSAARRDNPLLTVFPDEELTHYVEADAPSDAIAMGILTRRTTVDGHPCDVPLSLLISVPRAGRRHDAAEALRKNAMKLHPKLAVRAGANVDPALVRLAMEKPDLLHDVVDPFETASALLYQHPGLINLSVDKGGTIPSFILRKCIGDAINAKSLILNRIKRAGENWCSFVRLRDESGTIDDKDGPLFTMEVDDGVKKAMADPLALALKFSQQFMELQGQTWTVQYGRTSAEDRRAAMPQNRDVLRADQTKWTMKALSIEHGVNFHKVEYTEPVPGGWAIDAMWSFDSKPNPMNEAFVSALAAGEAFVRVVASPGPPDGFRAMIPRQRLEQDKATTFRVTGGPGIDVELRLDPMPTDLAVLVTRDARAPQQANLQGVRLGVVKNGKDEVLWTYDGSVANRGEIRVTAKNERLRHLSAYAEFFDSKGVAIQPGALAWLPPEVDKIFDGHPTKRYVDVIPPVDAVFGIPLPAEWLTLKIPFPENAVKMRLYWGGLGTGQYDSTVCPAGITCTSVFELALPVVLLIAGAADYKTGFVNELLKDRKVLFSIAAVAVALIGSGGYIGASQDPGAAAKTVATKLGPVFGKILAKKGAEKFAVYIARKYGEGAVKRAIPFVNVAFLAFDAAVTFAQLGQTIGAIVQSPFYYDVEITRSFDLAVQVKPDPQVGIFPDYHDVVRVQVVYDTGAELKHVEKTDLPKTTVKTPIDFTFAEAPAGGRMKVFVFFYAANGWQSAAGSTGWFDAKGENGTSKRQVVIEVKNALIPLSKTSVYKHLQSTRFENGKHQWKDRPAPSVTMASPSDPAHKLLSLNAITVAQKPQAIGYAWQANGMGLPRDRAGSPPTNDPLFVVQNISLADPSDGYAISPVGFGVQSGIAYEVGSADDGTGMNFFIDPSRGDFDPQSNPGGGFHIRRVALSSGGKPKFDVGGGQSWGRFPRPMDSFVHHPQGYICGITEEASKIYILKLPAAPVEDAKATIASLASGEGSRDGLMAQPRSIAVALDGRLLVLEAGNRRIQAFDYTGNPVQYFKSASGEKSPILALRNADKTTFLDLSVEAKGYIFVLGYTGDSATAKADQYLVDIYEPDGTFLVSTPGVAAAKIAVDLARSMFTLNWETLRGPGGRTEPSVSKWLPPPPDKLGGES
jgi:hypothetical protein